MYSIVIRGCSKPTIKIRLVRFRRTSPGYLVCICQLSCSIKKTSRLQSKWMHLCGPPLAYRQMQFDNCYCYYCYYYYLFFFSSFRFDAVCLLQEYSVRCTLRLWLHRFRRAGDEFLFYCLSSRHVLIFISFFSFYSINYSISVSCSAEAVQSHGLPTGPPPLTQRSSVSEIKIRDSDVHGSAVRQIIVPSGMK